MNIESTIDHTLLKPEAKPDDIRRICREALKYGFYGICVNSAYASLVRDTLKAAAAEKTAASTKVGLSDIIKISTQTSVLNAAKILPKIVVVVGFPLGAASTEAKAAETAIAVRDGANEIDTVIPIGRLIAGENDYVHRDIEAVVRAAEGRPVKVIIETGLLDIGQKILACQFAVKAGAAFVKTCTGFAPGSATVEDVRLMASAVEGKCKIKASGGIRDRAAALALIEAGASRLGTSSGVEIVAGHKAPLITATGISSSSKY